ncbi:MAG: Protein of unknown function (DUF2585) [Parcubacteria group bacterium Gr01-1014_29]|nr:MAG: Protein of unknown function (DUF2585) [Parcubacteria group bacterium Gr01-1014_29]
MNLLQLPIRTSLFVSAFAIVVFAVVLYFMGQPLICECGFVKFWHGPTVLTSENSQHISDWYTFSHIIHGFVFYWIAWLIGRKLGLVLRSSNWSEEGWSVGFMLLLAVLAETSWELFENTDFIINRYRAITISYDYFGDSVINSTSDVLAMVIGFFLVYRLPVFVIVILLITMELFVGYWIRDNLALNIIMLLYPFEAILEWQRGG